jgi:hypothetical protein
MHKDAGFPKRGLGREATKRRGYSPRPNIDGEHFVHLMSPLASSFHIEHSLASKVTYCLITTKFYEQQ